LSTKAIHLELVPDLSTEAYIASLRRFAARRGLCKNSDGTNFVGAEKEIRRIMLDKESLKSIDNYASQQRIKFHLVPPSP
jgi:hypothetical protein